MARIVAAEGGATRWLEFEGDPRQHYLARLEWASNSDEVAVQRLNRGQNVDEVLLGGMAQAGGGMFRLVRDAAEIPGLIREELQEGLAVVVTQARLEAP